MTPLLYTNRNYLLLHGNFICLLHRYHCDCESKGDDDDYDGDDDDDDYDGDDDDDVSGHGDDDDFCVSCSIYPYQYKFIFFINEDAHFSTRMVFRQVSQ